MEVSTSQEDLEGEGNGGLLGYEEVDGPILASGKEGVLLDEKVESNANTKKNYTCAHLVYNFHGQLRASWVIYES